MGLYVHLFYFHLFYISASSGWKSQWLHNLTNNYFLCSVFMIVATFVGINRSSTEGLIYIFLIWVMLNIFSKHCFNIYIYIFEDLIQYILIILNPSTFPSLSLFFLLILEIRVLSFDFGAVKGFIYYEYSNLMKWLLNIFPLCTQIDYLSGSFRCIILKGIQFIYFALASCISLCLKAWVKARDTHIKVSEGSTVAYYILTALF